MKLILAVLLMLVISSTQAQDCAPRFLAAGIYATIDKGLGFEFGAWPAKDFKLGAVGGFEIYSKTIETVDQNRKPITKTVMYSEIIARGIFRFNRYLYATGQIGIADFDSFVPGIGLRSVIPFNDGAFAIWLEPNATTQRFTFMLGTSFSIK